MIDQPTIDRILDAANIVDVVSEFVTLRKRGVNYVGLCPFHDDRSPSFYVSPAKNICKCFACGEGGTAVHFIMKHEQLNYYDALRYLARKYNIEIQERELTEREKRIKSDRESMLIVNEWPSDSAISPNADSAKTPSANSNSVTIRTNTTPSIRLPSKRDSKRSISKRRDWSLPAKMEV